MALSGAERVAQHRWATNLQKTLEKAQRLLKETPQKYRDQPWTIPIEPDGELFDCLEIFLGTEPEFLVEQGVSFVRFKLTDYTTMLPADDDGFEDYLNEINSYEAYLDSKVQVRTQSEMDSKNRKLSRNAFTKGVLKADLANPRWGWVGVKEPDHDLPGELYFFAWEHNRDQDVDRSVKLFSGEVSTDENGRKRPGHRDALEKISLIADEGYVPFVVWQTAVDDSAARKKIESINSRFVSECQAIYQDQEGTWHARLGPPRAL